MRHNIINSGLKAISEKMINDNFRYLFSKIENVKPQSSSSKNSIHKEVNLPSLNCNTTRFYVTEEVKSLSLHIIANFYSDFNVDVTINGQNVTSLTPDNRNLVNIDLTKNMRLNSWNTIGLNNSSTTTCSTMCCLMIFSASVGFTFV